MDIIRKSVYAAVGFAMMGVDKVEEAARKITQDAKMSEEEGRRYIDELVSKSRETKKEIENYVGELVASALKKMNIPTQKQIEEMQKRIAKLEREQCGCGEAKAKESK
ncbi:MAG: phasin family protein [Chitinispirillia bacterium]|nr:phasin family protein [Chitinispirillia bacterium]